MNQVYDDFELQRQLSSIKDRISDLQRKVDDLNKVVDDQVLHRILPCCRATMISELRDEVEQLRNALQGVFKPDGIPYAQWPQEWHAAHAALKRTKRGR
jgi:hypothetical protein